MLELGLVLALAQSCAPSASASTLAAIAHVESRFDPLAIGVNRGRAQFDRPRSPEEAAHLSRRLIRAGFNIDLGLAQINSRNLGWLGLSVEDAFDPCRNLQAAARVLQAGYRPVDASDGERQRALRVALSRYNTGHASRGFDNGYVAKVERAAITLSLALAPSVAPSAPGIPFVLRQPPRVQTAALRPAQAAPSASPPPPPAWDVFALRGDRILVFSPSLEVRP